MLLEPFRRVLRRDWNAYGNIIFLQGLRGIRGHLLKYNDSFYRNMIMCLLEYDTPLLEYESIYCMFGLISSSFAQKTEAAKVLHG